VSVLLLTLFCIALLGWSLNAPERGRRGKGRSRSRKAFQPGPYQAVSIVQPSCACSAVGEFEGARFLTDEAPLLPVPGCDAAKCTCRYTRHGDRRTRGDRRVYAGLQTELYTANGNAERRRARGRRKEDYESDAENFGLGEIEWVS
jgi:hypothetical protein